MEPLKRFLFWLLDGTRGGPTRAKLLSILATKPMNLHRLSIASGFDYSTIEHHIKLLEKHSIVECTGTGYGRVYFINESPLVEEYLNKKLEGGAYASKEQIKDKKPRKK